MLSSLYNDYIKGQSVVVATVSFTHLFLTFVAIFLRLVFIISCHNKITLWGLKKNKKKNRAINVCLWFTAGIYEGSMKCHFDNHLKIIIFIIKYFITIKNVFYIIQCVNIHELYMWFKNSSNIKENSHFLFHNHMISIIKQLNMQFQWQWKVLSLFSFHHFASWQCFSKYWSK